MNKKEIQTIDSTIEAISSIIKGEMPQKLDLKGHDNRKIKELVSTTNRLLESFSKANDFIASLAQGKLNIEVPVRNSLASQFKQLHSNLKHLTWQIQQVAMGDYDQSVDFLGDFSDNFNSMIAALREKKQVEEALRESEEKYGSLFRNSNDGIFIHDLKGNIIDVNQKVLDQFGYTKPEMLSIKIALLHPPEALSKSKWAFETIIRYGSVNFEIDFIKKNGAVFTAEVSSSLFKIGGKQVVQGIVRDITNRKWAEAALRESEEKFRSIYENAVEGFFQSTPEGRFISVNPSFAKMLGYTSPEDLISTISDIATQYYVNPEDRTQYKQLLLKDGYVEHFNFRVRCKDASQIWVSGSSRAIYDRNGKIVRYEGNMNDITDHKRAEEALKESEKKYRQIYDNIIDVYYEANIDGIILEVSPSIEKNSKYKREELIGKSIYDVYTNPEERNKLIETLINDGRVNEYELNFTDKDDTQHILSINSILIKDENGNPIKIVGIMRDISDRKKAEKEKMELEEKLLRSQKMESLGLLAGGVAHDLNNVLSGIVSYPELILMDLPEDSKLRKPIETIQESGRRAAAIVHDLLTVARGVATTKEPLNLNDLVGDYLHSPEFNKLKHFYPTATVKTNLDTDLFNIRGSHVHVRKVVMNLVSNAAEAIEGSGNVTISTVNRYVDRPLRGYDDVNIGEYAILSVSDDGSGISSDDLERIFEPFYTKKVMGRSGTGLGLAVVWNTVQDHKGYIDVATDKNGTTFELYFPITRDVISDKDLSIPIKDYKGNQETILVVDDEENQREISCKMLDKLGYKTKAVSSGEKAVEYLKETSVDLILLDMIMDPGINGRETYERIIKIYPKQKAIIISGFAQTDEVKKAQKLGAGQYIKKPVTLEKIGLAVKEELEK